jgi:hypothetical protein
MRYERKMEIRAQQRAHDELVHRLRDEAVAMAAAENIPIADAIETVTNDVEMRKAVRLVITWTPGREALAAERKRIYQEQLRKLQGLLRPLKDEAERCYCNDFTDEAASRSAGKMLVWLRDQITWPCNELLKAAEGGIEAVLMVIAKRNF